MHGNFNATCCRFRNVEPCWINRIGRAASTHTQCSKHTNVKSHGLGFQLPSLCHPNSRQRRYHQNPPLPSCSGSCSVTGCWPEQGQSLTIISAFHYSPSFSGWQLNPARAAQASSAQLHSALGSACLAGARICRGTGNGAEVRQNQGFMKLRMVISNCGPSATVKITWG